jgi:selenocysteine lyase/cysteine desulfurase
LVLGGGAATLSIVDSPAMRLLFPGAPGYLNTASLGLPPSTAVEAMAAALDVWQRGAVDPPDYDAVVTMSRRRFAAIAGVPETWVSVGSQVSGFVGLVAGSIPRGSVVLCPEGEFTSVLFPFLAQQERGVTVRIVPFADLAAEIGPEVTVVAFSAVRSDDGRVADLDAIRRAAATHGVLTLVDATQSAGWLPLDAAALDVVVAGAYKWLLSPRGTAFMTIRPGLIDDIVPAHAGWYAGESPWDSIYGAPLRLASSARRFDLSPAWLSWVGTAPALDLIAAVGVSAIHKHNVGLANRCRSAFELAPSNSAVVSIELPRRFGADRLSGIRAAVRAGRLRVCFHLYNIDDDVERVVEALTP